ncbi:sigma-70 family RNA polymerase sigma factor [Pedobacter sp. FW305-3-2-15-E-R2A2]|jgi:RNA polymerase sigma-70 factor (ECF subfamily)|uniref:RNA polymerase sigma factor n=1 Tax=Pedobacter sp. FW305-3-2-15-E-R2A2 TaxID=3140251 RepID=UPI00314013CB
MIILNKKSEKDLLISLKQGDEESFDILYHLYRSSLYNSIYKMVKMEEQSADLLQDLFIKIWQKRADIDPQLPFKAYVYRIAQNMVYDFFRTVARDRKLEAKLIVAAAVEPDYTPIDDAIADQDSKALIELLLSQLPKQCRQAYIYCKIEGRGYEETAILMGISKATVNNHITKANKLLKIFLEQSNYLRLMVLAIAVWSRS